MARGAPTPVATLDLETARYGVSVPNSVKGIAVAWDPQRKEIWHSGIFSTWLVANDPDTGDPVRAVDIHVDGFNPATLYIDARRRRLFWVNSRKEQIRVVDLDTGKLVKQIDVDSRGLAHYPTSTHALDIADGRLWVFNANTGTLNGYDASGGQSRPLTGVSRVLDISVAPSGGKLALIDIPSPRSARLLVIDTVAGRAVEACRFDGRPPKNVLLLDDGDLVLGGAHLRRVDSHCSTRWTLDLSEPPASLALLGDTLVAPLPTGGVRDGGIGSQVALIDLATGTLKAKVPSRYEARHVAVDAAGGRVFVGNAADGSISVIPLADPAATHILLVASSADDVVVDPTTGDRYVLSRLGGSRIYRWKKDGSVELFADQAPWPFALEIDLKRRLLVAPSFFEARLYVWPLDGGDPQTIDLGIPGSYGDTLGELGYDPETGVAAVIMPATGWLSVVDVDTARIHYTHRFESLAYGEEAGPGSASVAVAAGSVYVAGPVLGKTWRLGLDGDGVLASGRLRAASGPHHRPDRGSVYAFNRFHFDADAGRLFFGAHVLDPKTLVETTTLDGDVKVVYSDAQRLIALGVGADGHGDDIVTLDPTSLAETSRIPALASPTTHAEGAFDPTTGVIYLADLARARVSGFRVE
ncbi:MAG: hypothetical protein GXP62_07870 [Oligoflexia bacterium]|nr:hypothetical protein [Oligoflexia bacterium]